MRCIPAICGRRTRGTRRRSTTPRSTGWDRRRCTAGAGCGSRACSPWAMTTTRRSSTRRSRLVRMDDDEFEDYDREVELALYREYRDVVGQFTYVVETERRFYLANDVTLERHDTEHDFYFELTMNDV